MSLINEALKQARQAPPRQSPNVMPALPALTEEAPPVWGRLILGLIVLLVIVGVFFIGWSVAHRRVYSIVAEPDPATATSAAADASAPVMPTPETQAPVAVPKKEPAPVNLPAMPALPVVQGIFYSATAPSAIVNGKTVRPGSRLDQYLVKEISPSAVILVGPDQKEIRLGLGR